MTQLKALSLKTGRQSTLSQIDRIFAKDVLPWIGELSIFEVSRQHLVEVLRKIERRIALTTAEKCRTLFNLMLRYAMVEKGPASDLDIVAIPKRQRLATSLITEWLRLRVSGKPRHVCVGLRFSLTTYRGYPQCFTGRCVKNLGSTPLD